MYSAPLYTAGAPMGLECAHCISAIHPKMYARGTQVPCIEPQCTMCAFRAAPAPPPPAQQLKEDPAVAERAVVHRRDM